MIIFGYEIRKARKRKTAKERMDTRGYHRELAAARKRAHDALRAEVGQ